MLLDQRRVVLLELGRLRILEERLELGLGRFELADRVGDLALGRNDQLRFFPSRLSSSGRT